VETPHSTSKKDLTSFPPNFLNKTTSVAMEYYIPPNLITSLKIKYMNVSEPQLGEERLRNNEVMRLGVWG
jgi:hypothetical protein